MSSKLFTAEEQGIQGTTADFLPIAKLFGLGLLGAGAVKSASKIGGKMDDAIKAVQNKPLFSEGEIARQFAKIDADTKAMKAKDALMKERLKLGI